MSKPEPIDKTQGDKAAVPVSFSATGALSGVQAIGDMQPDTTYLVMPLEAHRLVTNKGFAYGTKAAETAANKAAKKAADDALSDVQDGDFDPNEIVKQENYDG